MSVYIAREKLNAAGDRIQIRIPDNKKAGAILVRAQGTYVGTLQAQSAADSDGLFNSTISLFDATDGGALAANEEGHFAGEYAAAEGEIRISFAAYTSGEVEVEVSISTLT